MNKNVTRMNGKKQLKDTYALTKISMEIGGYTNMETRGYNIILKYNYRK